MNIRNNVIMWGGAGTIPVALNLGGGEGSKPSRGQEMYQRLKAMKDSGQLKPNKGGLPGVLNTVASAAAATHSPVLPETPAYDPVRRRGVMETRRRSTLGAQ